MFLPTIELATVADAADCAGVSRAARKQALTFLHELHSEAEDLDYSNHVLRKDTVFVARDEQRRPVGFIAFSDGRVNHLYVLPSYQRLGIGGLLLDRAMGSFKMLKLWTFERNELARRFYENHGFSVIDRTDGEGNEEKEPDLLLQWNA
jgi:GNAT superfamily N-acetyltransferase